MPLSRRGMVDFMWAVLKTNASVKTAGAYVLGNYTQKQLSRGRHEVQVTLMPQFIEQFEELSGLTLYDLPKAIMH